MHGFPNVRLIFSLTLFFIQHASFSDSTNLEDDTAVLVGYGYSSDSQQVTDNACFNATVAKITARITNLKFDESISHSDLQKTFGLNLGITESYEQFSMNGKTAYLRSLQDNEYSVSLNYYVAHQEEVTVKIDGKHEHALTASGQNHYNDTKLYEDFGLFCGDNYIATFVQGGVLFVGLEIKLDNKEDKETLDDIFGVDYGEFTNVTTKIETISKSNNISGTIQISAFQFGGDTAEITRILSENAAICDINSTAQCSGVINSLESYAVDFGKQIKNGKGLEALGPLKYLPIYKLGLIAPNSSVTSKVAQSRKDLAAKLKENRYYERKLSLFVRNKYPVKLKDELIAHIKSLLSRAKHNLYLIMDPNHGAVRCFNTPKHCEEIKNNIYDNLKNITTDDLKFVKSMKYIFPFKFEDVTFVYYNVGENLKLWKSVPMAQGDSYKIEMVKFHVSDENFEFHFREYSDGFYFNGAWNFFHQAYVDRLMNYFEYVPKGFYKNHIQKLEHSPFFFEEYNSSMDKI